ncbi:MAG TPA: NAD(P)-binding domain-containing protein [Solirubrobacterales bacterium]|nr:NAD(P)-binding domain-containing protein [Solirubrobacterales bacterium]
MRQPELVDELVPHAIDRARLEAAIGAANIPALAMVLHQLTGERRWLEEPYRSRRGRGLGPNDSGGLPEEIAADVRAAAIEAIVAWSEGEPVAVPAPDPELLREMFSICMDEEVPPEYERMMREEMGFAPVVTPAAPAAGPRLSAVIVGAGISGLTAALRLREAGLPYVVLERNEEVGGVWITNTYPGAGVDTPSYLYSYSFFPRAWGTHFSKRDEVARYVAEMADHYGLREEIRFGVDVDGAEYDEDGQCWTVAATGPDGEELTFEADILITAVGLFNQPSTPDLPGLDTFRGEAFHSAEWPDGVDLRGKRVAVVGSGASAMQIVPAIVDEVAALTVFQRSPQWIAPNDEYFAPVSGDVHWLMDHVPYYRVWYRFRLAWTWNDRVQPSLIIDPEWTDPARSLNAVNDGHRRYFTRYVEDQLAGHDDLIAKSVPSYPPFGKRMLLDNGWFAALKRDQVELVTDRVAALTETGVVTAAGEEFEVDVVIFSTGFKPREFLGTLDVRGRGGRTLRETWGEDDATAYLGMTIPGFPNLFVIYGPNTGLGAGGSYIFVAECDARYIVNLLVTMCERGDGAVECRADVHDRWVAEVDAAHDEMVWSHPGMSTYYRNSAGRIVTNLPWRVVDYWSMTQEVDLDDYVFEPRAGASTG